MAELKNKSDKQERELLEACRDIEEQVKLVRLMLRFIDDNREAHLAVCDSCFGRIRRTAEIALNS